MTAAVKQGEEMRKETDKDHGHCNKTDKLARFTRSQAKKMAKRVGSKHKKHYSVYHCRHCGLWHLTSKPQWHKVT